MKSINLQLDENILSETEKILENMKKSRNRYLNEAIDYYNKLQRRVLLKKQLKQESILVRESSMEVLCEFENLEDDYEAI